MLSTERLPVAQPCCLSSHTDHCDKPRNPPANPGRLLSASREDGALGQPQAAYKLEELQQQEVQTEARREQLGRAHL